MKQKLFSIVAVSILATALVATAIGASTGPVGVVSLIEINPKDKAQNEKNGDGRAPVLLATHSFVEITQIERLRAFQACQKAGRPDCNTDKYRHEWSVPFITVENANKLEKALSVAWNRFDARVAWRINTTINNFGVLPFPHRDYLLPTFSFATNCINPVSSLTNQDSKLGAWDGNLLTSMKAGDFCDGLSLDKAVSLASTHLPYPVPCGLGGGTVYWNEVARRYAEAMKHALSKYYPDYWIDVAKAFAMYMPQALDWGGFGPTSSLVPGTEGGSLIAPVYSSIPNPVQYINLATKAAALDPLVGYSYIMQKYPYMLNPIGNAVLQNKGVLSLANVTNEPSVGISQLEQLKYNLSTREDIFNRAYQWSLTGQAKPKGSDGVGTLREVEAVGYAPFLRVFSRVDTEISPRPVMLMVSCGQLVFTPFPNLVERIYPVPVSPGPLPVTYIVPRVHTQWMSVPEGYEIPKVKGVPSFKTLGLGFAIPSLPTMPTLPTFEVPTLPTTTTITETLTKPLKLPTGFVVPIGNSITLPSGQILNAGDKLKEAFTLPTGTQWLVDTAKKAATDTVTNAATTAVTNAVTGGSSGTTKPTTGSTATPTTPVQIPVPAPNTTTIPGLVGTTKPATGGSSTKPTPSVAIPVPAPNTTKPTPTTTTKPSTQPVNNGSSNPTSTAPTQTVTAPPAPTPANTAMFPVLYKGVPSSHCVQMLNALLYGVNAISVGTTKMNQFLDAVSEYGTATAGAVINYRKTYGFAASNSVDTTLWIDLFSRSNNNTGRTLAVQIGLVAQGYDITINGKWNSETQTALNDFAAKNEINATMNVKLLSKLMIPCQQAILSGGSSSSTPEATPTTPTQTAPTSVAVQIRSSVYYPGCQRWDNSIKPGCNLSIEGGAIDARNASMPGSTYAVAIPAMNIYSEKKGGCQIPYGSVLKITNPRTGRSANATVRDGGPYVPGRNMDMTEPVARDIGFGETVDNVMVELVSVPAPYDNRATYCFGNSLKNGVNGGFPKNTSTIAQGPTLGFPNYAKK